MRLSESSSHPHCVRTCLPHAFPRGHKLNQPSCPLPPPPSSLDFPPCQSTHSNPPPFSQLEMLSLESDHYRHLPQMYHADAIRDMDIRPNVNSLDLASPPPSRQAMRNSQPLTPPITPSRHLQPSSRPLPRFIPILPPHDDSPTSSTTDHPPSSRSFLKVQEGSSLSTRYLVVTGLPPEIPAQKLTHVFSVSLSSFCYRPTALITPPYSV